LSFDESSYKGSKELPRDGKASLNCKYDRNRKSLQPFLLFSFKMMRRSKGWYKPKGYLHFSPKLRKNDESTVLKYITNKLEKHNFYPLIHETLSARRYKKIADGTRSHFDYLALQPKPTAKDREIFYANHLDAHIYSYYANEVLGPKYERLLKSDEQLDHSIIAYRHIPISKKSKKGKCNIHFAKEVFNEIEDRGNCVAVCYDIENFFPTLNHEHLKNSWCNLLGVKRLDDNNFKIFKSITNYSFVEIDDIISACTNKELGLLKRHDFYNVKPRLKSYFTSSNEFRKKIAAKNLIKVNPRDKGKKQKGIPQGTPISAFLANLYLLQFDRFVVESLVKQANCFYRRYSDDIIIIFENESKFIQFDEIIRDKLLSEPFCLKVNSTKTIVSKFVESDNELHCSTKIERVKEFSEDIPLRYLGFDFNGKTILLKDGTVSNYYRELKESLRIKGNRVKAAKKFNLKNPDKTIKETKLFLTNLMKRFTHLGKKKTKSNFLTYVDRAAKIMHPELTDGQNPIRRQLRRSWSIFNSTADRYR
jgi:hypothetical protein